MVVSLGIFWAAFAVLVFAAAVDFPPGAFVVVIGLASGFFLYYTLFEVWADRLGRSPLRSLLWPSLSTVGTQFQVMLKLMSPPWQLRVIRTTGWSVTLTSGILLALLALDLVLAGWFATHLPSGNRF